MPPKENSEKQIKSSLLNSSETTQRLKSCATQTLGSRILPRELVFFKGYFSVKTHSPLGLSLTKAFQLQAYRENGWPRKFFKRVKIRCNNHFSFEKPWKLVTLAEISFRLQMLRLQLVFRYRPSDAFCCSVTPGVFHPLLHPRPSCGAHTDQAHHLLFGKAGGFSIICLSLPSNDLFFKTSLCGRISQPALCCQYLSHDAVLAQAALPWIQGATCSEY